MPLCVGLTGGIGSGKSAAAEHFASLGAVVVDTDAISHELTAAGGAAIGALREHFGPESIAADRSLDRAWMRQRVFGNPAARKELESILHPLIQRRAREAVAAARASSYVVLVVPLLFETGAYLDIARRVLVVDCDEEELVRRASARSGITPEEVRRIMAAQLPRAERRARADDVIDNNGSLDALHAAVAGLHEKYLRLARGG